MVAGGALPAYIDGVTIYNRLFQLQIILVTVNSNKTFINRALAVTLIIQYAF